MANIFSQISTALGFGTVATTTTAAGNTAANYPWNQLSGINQQILGGTTWAGGPTWASSTISVLDPETASNLIAQCEQDDSLVTSGRRLKFGTHRGKKLTRIDIEYLVALGRSVQRLRKEVALELRRRQAVKRLVHTKEGV